MDEQPRPGMPASLVLVGVGGGAGSVLRALAGHPSAGSWPWATLVINLVGAFVLAAMLELMARVRRSTLAWRLLLGTGFMGGFTTYSAFALETLELLRAGREQVALLYVALSVGGGLAAALCALVLVSRLPLWPRRQP